MISYLKRHWRGQLTLMQALWVNLVLFSLIFYSICWALLQITLKSSQTQSIILTASFLIFQFIALTWQLMGVIKTIERYLSTYEQKNTVRLAQLCILFSITGLLVWSITVSQSLSNYWYKLEEKQKGTDLKPNYNLYVTNDRLQINGILSPGITREVKKILSKKSGVSTLILNSSGGNIYEARGLAKLVLNNQLNTHSSTGCFSACSTVFIAGIKRTLNQNANLGFHQYKIDSQVLLPLHTNLVKEQQIDLLFFKQQGINADFLKQIFSHPYDEIWQPDKQLLLSAKVIHALIKDK